MRALIMEGFGLPPVIREVPEPAVGPGEVLVRIAAASVNPFDRFVLAGSLKDRMEHHFPIIIGRDYAGTIEAVGEDVGGDGALAVGDRVLGMVTKALGPGGIAERIAAPAGHAIVRLPASIGLEAAPALGLAGVGALGIVEAADPQPGQTVLISGATGGIGSLAIQLVVARGATVIATAGSDEGRAFVRELGATHVVDRFGDVVAQVRAIAPKGIHSIIHLAGDGVALADLLVPGGRVASLVGIGPETFEGRDITGIRAPADSARLADVIRLAASGALRPQVTRVLTLDEAPIAFTERTPVIGKTVVRIA